MTMKDTSYLAEQWGNTKGKYREGERNISTTVAQPNAGDNDVFVLRGERSQNW